MPSAGAIYALLAYVAWGVSPIFWRELRHVPALYVLGQRVVWAAVVFGLLLFWRRRGRELARALRTRSAFILAASAALLATNWFVYLYAVNTDRVLDASLGYFINPLLNIVLGMMFLGERLRPVQWFAVALAALGVSLLAFEATQFPWISLVLAGSFGVYGLLRKTVSHDALLGSNLETLFLIPLALPILATPTTFGITVPQLTSTDHLLLAATGLQTALPLLWFSNAARRLPLSTLGFFQYLAPSLQFLVAVFLFKEPFGATQFRSFLLIWIALAAMTLESQIRHRRVRRPTPIQS